MKNSAPLVLRKGGMNPDSKPAHPLRWTTVILFFIVLWVPMIQMIHPFFPEMKPTDNRKLAEKPRLKLSPRALKNFTKQYGLYLNDHYGLRNLIIKLNCMAHIDLLNTSPTKDVVLGRQGWLYYDSRVDGISLKDFCGDAPFHERELNAILGKVGRLNSFCEERGMLFRVVVAPNKHTIYPEFLPSAIKSGQGTSTCLDQLKEALVRNGLESVLIDLRPTLLSGKRMKPYPLYYQTDTHWNQMGAFIAYTEIMKNLLPRFPRINILDIRKYTVIQEENRGRGDLSKFISMSGVLKDTEIILDPQTAGLSRKTDPGLHVEGAYSIERYRIEKSNYPRLLMFLDSFGASLIPYLSESFSDSLYLWYTPPDADLSIIEKEKPQVVILELAERYLQSLSRPLLRTLVKP